MNRLDVCQDEARRRTQNMADTAMMNLKRMNRAWWIGVALAAWCVLACQTLARAADSVQPKTVRLLTIGNSFSANATRYLKDIALAGGHMLIHGPIVVGGASMQLHAEKLQTHERDPKDKAGLYSGGRSLKQQLQAEPWDYVTIQQRSLSSHDFDTYQPYAGQLAQYIHRYAPQAKLMIHQTWAYRVDDPRFAVKEPKPGEPATRAAMHDGLTHAYRSIATELGAGVIPVGLAFDLADTDPRWGFKPDGSFNAKSAKYPALPDQTHSLHVGWRWRKQKDNSQSLGMDGHHANMAGEYLGACVFYETLFGESVVGNKFVPKGLDAEHARFLQETAHRAVVSWASTP